MLWTILLWMWVCQYVFEIQLSILLDACQTWKSGCWDMVVFLLIFLFWETTTVFFIVTGPLYTLTKNLRFQFLYVHLNTFVFDSGHLGVRWYLTGLLFCISLMISYVGVFLCLAGHLYTICSSPFPTCRRPSTPPGRSEAQSAVGVAALSLGLVMHKVLFVPPKWLWRVWGFDFNMIVPLLPPYCDFFVLGHGTFIWWVSTSSCQWLFSS